MKKIAIYLLLLLTLPITALAKDNPLAVGIVMGQPDGFTLDWKLHRNSYIQSAIGSNFGPQRAVFITSNLITRVPAVFGNRIRNLHAHFGVGAQAVLEKGTRFGVRVPLGITYTIPNSQIEWFAEFAPIFELTPITTLYFGGAIGVRYRFI